MPSKSRIRRSLQSKGIRCCSHRVPTIIMKACMDGNLELLKENLADATDVDWIYHPEKDTPLIFAARYGSLSLVEFLIEKKANVNHANANGKTPLMSACEYGHWQCVRALLYSWQVDIDKVDCSGNTALIYASNNKSNIDDLRIIELLLEQGADLDRKNEMEMTASMYCARRTRDGLEAVKMLHEAGADPKAVNETGANLMLQVADDGHADILRWCLENGHNSIEDTNVVGENALLIALSEGHEECVEILLEAGSNPNSVSILGTHALNYSAADSFKNTLLLLKYGAIPRPSKVYIKFRFFLNLPMDVMEARMDCQDFFQPTDIAVLHGQFAIANFLLNIMSCHPLHQVTLEIPSHTFLTQISSQPIYDFMRRCAKTCPDWVKITNECISGPSTLVFLSQQVVSNLAGHSKNRKENLYKSGLPPRLIRNILLEGLQEEIFVLSKLPESEFLSRENGRS